MNSKKVFILIAFLIAGIIGASFLIQPKNADLNNTKPDSRNNPDETDDSAEIRNAMDKMYELINISNVIGDGVFKEGFRKGMNIDNIIDHSREIELLPEYFRLIKDQGFDFVRIPIQWSAHWDWEMLLDNFSKPININGNIDPAFLEKADYIIQCALDNGLGAVITVSEFEEVMNGASINLTDDGAYNIDSITMLKSLWTFLSIHYKNLPDNVLFEILDEPRGILTTERWNSSQCDIYSIIRDANPKRGIIFQAGAYGGYSELTKLRIPKNDKNIILSFHFYDPVPFTLDGLGQWDDTEFARKKIDAVFNNVKALSETTGLPIFLGAFGTTYRADTEQRALWTRRVRETAEKYGFTWCYWDSPYTVFNRENLTFDENLTSALLDGKPSDFNTGKSNVKLVVAGGTSEYMINFVYQRKMYIACEDWTNIFLYFSNNTTQIAAVDEAAESGYITIPVSDIAVQNLSPQSALTFTKNTIELTVKNVNDSITDLRIALCQGVKEAVLYDNDHFDKATKSAYDSKTVITLKISDYLENFPLAVKTMGEYTEEEINILLQQFCIKIFAETVPERKDNYDRKGSLEFVDIITY